MAQQSERPDWQRLLKLLALGWAGWNLLSEDDRRWLTEILRQVGTSPPPPPPRSLSPAQSPPPLPAAPVLPPPPLGPPADVSSSNESAQPPRVVGIVRPLEALRRNLEETAAQPSSATPKPAPSSKPDPDPRWRSVIRPPAIILILGALGSGKSALAYFLLELFRFRLNVFVVGVPPAARQLLPPWIGIASTLEEVPQGSIALVDEGHLHYHARSSAQAESKAMSQLLGLSRQRDLTIVVVSPDARQIDINLVSSSNVIIAKEPSAMRLEFERRELRPFLERAKAQFSILRGDKRGWSHVYAPDVEFEGMLPSPLPSFWTPRLSKLFAAGQEPSAPRAPQRPSTDDRIREAQRLDALGSSNAEISRTIGVSKATVVNYLRDYPYRRPRK